MIVWLISAGLLGCIAAAPKFLVRTRRIWIPLSALWGILACIWGITGLDDLELRLLPPIITRICPLLINIVLQGQVGTALLLAVCWMGVLPRKYWLRKRWQAVRGPLSIALGWLILPHIFTRLWLFRDALFSDGWLTWLACNSILCLLLTVPLWITSWIRVRKRMKACTWSRLQRTAYLLYLLVYLHGITLHLLILHNWETGLLYLATGILYLTIRSFHQHTTQS